MLLELGVKEQESPRPAGVGKEVFPENGAACKKHRNTEVMHSRTVSR